MNMNMKYGMLILAGVALAASSLRADPFLYNNSDLLLVFRQPGSPDLEVNIGSVSRYRDAAPGSVLSITSFSLAQLQLRMLLNLIQIII